MSSNQKWTLETVVRHEQGGRSTQRDAVYAAGTLVAIADGIGSGVGAASAAIDSVAQLDRAQHADPMAALGASLTQARAAIQAEDSTTLTALWFQGDEALSAHIGDCRLHRIRDGRVELLTRDHTLVAALVEEGRLTVDEARGHEHRALLNRALASDPVGEPDLGVVDVAAGDRFALTSKGVHAVVDNDELETLLLTATDLESMADRVADSVERAGAPDNYSLVLVEVAE